MATNHIKVTELDPAQIKANLKEYFSKEGSPYKDWNFESSGLDLQLAVLAYNTHMNSILASTAFNESFIESAQLRKNLVSNARTLGYVPRSRRASFIDVKLKFYYDPDSTSPDVQIVEPILSKNTQFITRNDENVELTFITANDVVGIKTDTGTADFPKEDDQYIRLYQGNFQSESFVADSSIANQAFKLNSSTIDTDTITVRVDNEDYSQSVSLADLSPDSSIYFIDESSSGEYEIYFGNGVLGKKVPNLANITVSYIETAGEAGNDLATFEFTSSVDAQLSNSGALLKVPPQVIITPGAKSSGGGERESMSSIRFNAPKSFITQNRAVTVQDYENVIMKRFSSSISSAVAWGGDVDALDVYDPTLTTEELFQKMDDVVGVANISAINTNKEPISEEDKTAIDTFINDKRVFTVKTKFVDAAKTDIIPTVVYRYDAVTFNGSLDDLRIALRNTINNFSDDQLGKFKTRFNLSRFYTALDATDVNVKSTYVNSLRLRTYLELDDLTGNDDVHLMPKCSCDLEDFELEGDELTAYRNTPDYTHNLVTSDFWVAPYNEATDTTENNTWTIRDFYNGVADQRGLYLYKVSYNEDGAITSINRYGSVDDDMIGKINRLSNGSIQMTLFGADGTGLSNDVISRLVTTTPDEIIEIDLAINVGDVEFKQNAFGSILGDETSITAEKIND